MVAVGPTAAYAPHLVSEGLWYLAGGALAFAGLAALVLAGPSWLAVALLVGGVAALAVGAWLRRRRSRSVQVEIEGDHLHPIPVLDQPKGTYDLIAGLTVRVDNRQDQPVGVRIDTLLYRRTPWKWDRPVSDAGPVALLAPSVVPGRSAKSFFVKNYTRIPAGITELTPRHFVKLVIGTSDSGKSVHRVFLRERFELPKESPRPARRRAAAEGAPLLPFSERLEPEAREPVKRSLGERLRGALSQVGIGRPRRREVRIHRLGNGDDSLDGLIEELDAELADDRRSGGQG